MLNNKKQLKKHTQFFNTFLIVSAMVVLFLNQSRAQNTINSPYSMFGPGEVKAGEFFRNMSMGGISQGFRDSQTVNFVNPASYTVTDSLSFIFDATVFYHLYQQKVTDPEQEQLSSYSSPGSLAFSFPVFNWWSVAAGFMPYSQKGYQITDLQSDESNGTVNYLYEGSGGINRLFLGHGFKVFKGLSVGVNFSYLFGKSEDLLMSSSDSTGFFRTAWRYSDNTDGLLIDYGMQWEIPLRENQKLTFGATYTQSSDVQLKQNTSVLRDLPGVTFIQDTLRFKEGDKGEMYLPDAFGAGVFMQFNPHWGAGFDFQTQNWSQYAINGNSANLNDSRQFRLGVVYNPQVETYSGFLSRLEYRAGIRYGESFLNVQNSAFDEFGISFGLSVPVRRSLSALNVGFEYSQRTPANEGLISEDFFRFNIGVNINERWFVKRKFY